MSYMREMPNENPFHRLRTQSTYSDNEGNFIIWSHRDNSFHGLKCSQIVQKIIGEQNIQLSHRDKENTSNLTTI